jgi:hypothetical protein
VKPSTDPAASDDQPAGDAERREVTRFPLLLNAQCINHDGREVQVWLIDISQTGCQIFTGAALLTRQDAEIVLSYGDESRSGEVAWTAGMKAGVRFDLALPPLVISQLLTAKPSAPLQMEYCRDWLVDKFGRKLAPLPPLAKGGRTGL